MRFGAGLKHSGNSPHTDNEVLMRNRVVILAVFLSVLLLAVVAGVRLASHEESGLRMDVPKGGDFKLQSADGPVSLADFRGRVVVLYFGYTFCPDICPSSLAMLAAALRQLTAEELDRLQVLFISVDPERDGLGHLKQYARYFHEKMIGLTGSPEAVKEVADRYGAAYRKAMEPSGSAYTVDHSANLYLINAEGRLVGQLAHGTPPQEIHAALLPLLHPH